jgi:hypothetical protein
MRRKQVRQGHVSVGRSAYSPYVLLQTTDDRNDARIVLTVEETEELIEDLKEMISKVRMFPGGPIPDEPI